MTARDGWYAAARSDVHWVAPGLRDRDIAANDTAKVALSLPKVTALKEVRITALSVRERRKADFEEHRRLGIGRFLDSTTIEKRVTIAGALAEAPQLKVKWGGIVFNNCVPIVWIDRQMVSQEELKFLSPKTIAATEIYPRKFMIPSEF